MSARNGDRARFQKDRKRKLRHRQRVQEYLKVLRAQPLTPIVSDKVISLLSRLSLKLSIGIDMSAWLQLTSGSRVYRYQSEALFRCACDSGIIAIPQPNWSDCHSECLAEKFGVSLWTARRLN
jgi:hypothetical protein